MKWKCRGWWALNGMNRKAIGREGAGWTGMRAKEHQEHKPGDVRQQGSWELTSNSICLQPRECARSWRFFPKSCREVGLLVSLRSSIFSSADQGPSLTWSEGEFLRTAEVAITGERVSLRVRVCCEGKDARLPIACETVSHCGSSSRQGCRPRRLEAQSLHSHFQTCHKCMLCNTVTYLPVSVMLGVEGLPLAVIKQQWHHKNHAG